jgi:hypothetical protein
MPPLFQTILAFGIVALAAGLLLRSWLKKKPSSGCGSDTCSAVTQGIKSLRKKARE